MSNLPYSLFSGGHAAPSTWRTAYRVFMRNRDWFGREALRHPLHPLIHKILEEKDLAAHCRDWREMLLEHPYTADTDPTKLAYTRSEEHGIADRQTTTSPAKYIKGHCPTMPDHILRDLVAAAQGQESCKFVYTTEEMIDCVMRGPSSCMSGARFSADEHPYQVYAPEHGWSLAVRYGADGSVQGRCLCNNKRFVRSYAKRDGNDCYSHSDTILEAWLQERGYAKESDFEGCKVLKIKGNADYDEYVMPYIDGGVQSATVGSDYLIIEEGGEYDCSNTDGTTTLTGECCDDCGSRESREDGYWVGYHQDNFICSSCIDNYAYAYGRNGNQYYCSTNDIVCVDDEYYHDQYLSDNGIVCLANGEYASVDDAVCIKDYWYHVDGQGEIWVYTEDENEQLIEDAWCCEHSGSWYSKDTEPVEIDGATYHGETLLADVSKWKSRAQNALTIILEKEAIITSIMQNQTNPTLQAA